MDKYKIQLRHHILMNSGDSTAVKYKYHMLNSLNKICLSMCKAEMLAYKAGI